MPRCFTALSSIVAVGFALSANAMVTHAVLSPEKNQAAFAANIEQSPAGRDYKVYPTSTARYAILQGKHGLVLVKKTPVGVQHFAINAEGLNSVAEADAKLMEPLIAKYGMDKALAQLEEVVLATSGDSAQTAAASEIERGGAKLILVDGVEQPRRRYPPRRPINQGYYDNYGPGPDQGGFVGGGGGFVGGGGGCGGAPCGGPCGGGLCGPPPYYGGYGVNAPAMLPAGRIPCDRRIYGPYCS